MSAVYAPKGFTIERTQTKEEANMGVVRYRFSVDMHLDLTVTGESESSPSYLQTTMEHGIRQLAHGVQKRLAEVAA